MATKPKDVGRLTPPHGTVWDLARNRDITTGAGKLTAADVTISTDRLGVWRQWEMVAGWPVDHGEVADQAAMLALHTFGHSALTQPLPRYVAPGDSCTRTDDPGWRWHCLRGHGTMLTDWERRPLSGALTGLSASGHTHSLLSLTEVVTALDGKQDALSNAAALARITAEAGGLPKWDGGDWPGGGSSGGPSIDPDVLIPALGPCAWWRSGVGCLDGAGDACVDGAVIATWQDQSGHGCHWEQVTEAQRHVFVTDSLGGEPSVMLAGGYMVCPTFPSIDLARCTLFIAAARTVAAANARLLVLGSSGSGSDYDSTSAIAVTSSAHAWIGLEASTSGGSVGSGLAPAAVYAVRTAKLGTTARAEVSVGDTIWSAPFAPALGASNPGALLGAHWLAGAVYAAARWSGPVYEIVIIPRSLSNAELGFVSSAIRRRYGI